MPLLLLLLVLRAALAHTRIPPHRSQTRACARVTRQSVDAAGSAAASAAASAPHKVVIKTFKKAKLLSRPDLQQKLKQEWEIHASLEHPNIIRAYLAAEDDSSVGLFMEYAGAALLHSVH